MDEVVKAIPSVCILPAGAEIEGAEEDAEGGDYGRERDCLAGAGEPEGGRRFRD
jgi:hypothetical protein